MKYFGIRLSLVINFVLISAFFCIDIDHTPTKNWVIYGAVVAVYTLVNWYIMTRKYTAEEREAILFSKYISE